MKPTIRNGYLLLLVALCYGIEYKIHPECDMTLEQRVRRHGYPIEAHMVTTEDGYIISVYNIPHGLKKTDNKNKSAVLIMHGMGGSPHNFVAMGRQRSPPYYFADRDMDVWLFCSRGHEGSFKEKHVRLDWEKDRRYWLHSWHEIGKYDLTATIDYILNYTGQSNVALIGHSAGGNEFFCMMSEKPEYNSKVKVAISWGSSPIIKGRAYPLMMFGCLLVDIAKGLLNFLGLVELFSLMDPMKPVLKLLCADPYWYQLCIKASWVIGSHKSYLQRPEDIQVIATGTSKLASMQVFHFMDNVNSGKFRKYDFGARGNMRRYGQKEPPDYNLTAATAPVAFFVGLSDGEISKEDVHAAMELIPNTVLMHEVAFPKFTHLDFIFGHNSSELVYEPTYRLINDIDNGIIYPKVNASFDYD